MISECPHSSYTVVVLVVHTYKPKNTIVNKIVLSRFQIFPRPFRHRAIRLTDSRGGSSHLADPKWAIVVGKVFSTIANTKGASWEYDSGFYL